MMKAAIYISLFVATFGHWHAANGQLSESQKDFVLTTHNQFRSEVSPTANIMLEMVWNEELANIAQSHSQQCVFTHNEMSSAQSAVFESVGENLAIVGPLSTTWGENELLRLLNLWANEADDYSLSENTCSGECGHYTQLVWAETDQVGCGVTLCPNLTISDSRSLQNSLNLVCNYGPAGNVNSRRPYTPGVSCSACPSEYTCRDNLCSLKETSPVQPLTTMSPTTETPDPNPVDPDTTQPTTSIPNTPDTETTVPATVNPNTSGAETTVPATVNPNTSGAETTVPATVNPNTSGAETTVPATSTPVQPSTNNNQLIAIYFRIIQRLRQINFINSELRDKIINQLLQRVLSLIFSN